MSCEHLVTRVEAMPPFSFRLLQALGSVAAIDGAMYLERADGSLELLPLDHPDRASELARDDLAVANWRHVEEVGRLDAFELLLTSTTCRWAGVALVEPVAQGRGHYLGSHRCLTTGATRGLRHISFEILGEVIGFDLPEQDLRIRRKRIPTRPERALRVRNIPRWANRRWCVPPHR